MKKRLLLLSVAMLTAMCAFAQNETRRFSERENRSERETRSERNLRSERENRNERETNLRSRQEQRNLLLPIQSLDVLRASQQTVLLLDSMIIRINPVFYELYGESDMKTAFHYNSAGQLILEIRYEWNADTRQWEERGRRAFDNRGNMILDIYSWRECLEWDWNTDTCLEDIIIRGKWTAEYDTGDNRISSVSYWYNPETSTFVRWSSREYAWDSRGNQILGIEFNYDADGTVSWGSRSIRAYDHLGWRTLEAEYRWENNGWVGSDWDGRRVTVYTDNADSFTIAENRYRWENGAWQISSKREDTFLGRREDDRGSYEVDFLTPFPNIPQPQRTTQLLRSYIGFDWDGYVSWSDRTEYILNADGTVAERRRFHWEDNMWKESSRYKFEYTYNAHGMLTAKTVSWWNPDINAWEIHGWDSFTVTYTLDSRNNPLSYRIFTDGYEFRRVYFTYDAQDRAVTAEVYEWLWNWNNELIQVKSESFKRAFDNQGRVILADHTWISSGSRTIVERAYDADGRNTMNSHRSYGYGYDEHNQLVSWADGNKRKYAFDAEGRRIMEASWRYCNDLREFVGRWKYRRAFDANGNNILWMEYRFDLTAMAFVPSFKEEITYTDVKINLWGEYGYVEAGFRFYVWENGTWVLQYSARWDWTFDQENNPLSARIYFEGGGMPEIWYASITFYYSLHLTNLPSVTNNDLRVWISGGELHIEGTPTGSAVQIFDTQGRQMFHTTWTNSTINISHLQSGIYIVRAGESVVKVVKR